MGAEKVIKKLRMDKASNILIVNAPKEFTTMLSGISHDSKPSKKKMGSYDYVQVFATTQSELEKLVKEVEDCGVHDCLFWASYPKGGGKIKSDIKRETVWIALDLIGLQTVTQIAIDETWSALRARPVHMVGK